MIQFVIAAVVAAAAAGLLFTAWGKFKDGIAAPYVQAQITSDQAHLDKADANAKAAEADRDTARANAGRCDSALKVADKGRADAEKQAKDNLIAARASKAENDRERAASRPYIAGLQADVAAKADKALTCEQRLQKVDAVLTEALKRGRVPPGATK